MSIDLGQAILHVVADRTNVDSTLRSLEGSAQSWSSRVGGILSNAFSFALGGFLQNTLAQATSTISNSIIGVNSMLETTNKRFTTLMGDASKAADHVKMLFDLGAQTPYTTEELIQMSTAFQSAGGEILNTKENMILFGDAAAAVQAPLDKVGMWVGRLYQAVQNGRPFGDAAMNLGELNVLSGQARMRMEDMQKAGKSSAEIWAVFTEEMAKSKGAMASMATTWTGLTSTLEDNLSMFGAKAFAPVFEGAKKLVSGLITLVTSPEGVAMQEWLTDKIGAAVTWATDTAFPALVDAFNAVYPAIQQLWSGFQTAYGIIEPIVSEALSWGTNIGSQLAQGIYDSAEYVVDAMSYIGDTLAYWLAPGSPPKVSPFLDQWGKLAGEEFFNGFSEADSGAVQNMGKTLKDILGDIAAQGGMSEEGIIPTMIGTRQAFARVIDEINQTGSVSDETFRAMQDAAGPASVEVTNIANAYLDLKQATQDVVDAQQELNDVTAEYDARLAPLNAEMKALQDQKDAIDDAQKIQKLNETIADDKSTEQDKEKARIEIQMLQKKRQIEQVEDEKDAAVDTAKEKLDAAKDNENAAKAAYQATQQQIAAHHEENELIKQQIALLQQIEKENAPKGGGGGKGGPKPGPKPQPPKPPAGPKPPTTREDGDAGQDIEGPIMAQVSSLRGRLREAMSGIVREVTETLQPIATAGQRIFRSMVGLVEAEVKLFVKVVNEHGEQMVSDMERIWNNAQATVRNVLDPLSRIISSFLDSITTWIGNNGAQISAVWGTVWTQVADIVNTAIGIIAAIVVPFLEEAAAWWEKYGDRVQLLWTALWNTISQVLISVLAVIQGVLHTVMAAIHGDWQGVWTGMQQIVTGIVNAIQGVISGVLDAIAATFGTTMGDIERTWSSNWENIKALGQRLWDELVRYLSDGVSDMVKPFTDWWNDVSKKFSGWVSEVKNFGKMLVDGIIKGIIENGSRLVDAFVNAIEAAFTGGEDAAEVKSPSERGARLGEMITQGIADGMMRAVEAVRWAGGELVDEIFGVMKDVEKSAQDLINDAWNAGFQGLVDAATQDLQNLRDLQDMVMSQSDYDAERKRIMNQGDSDNMKKLKDEAKDLQKDLDDVQKEIEDVPYATDVFSAAEAAQMEQARNQKIAELEAKANTIRGQMEANDAAQQAEEAARQARINEELRKLDERRATLAGQAQWAQQQMAEARRERDQMAETDTEAADRWYAMKSQYVKDYSDLYRQYQEADNDEERKMIGEQMKYVNDLWYQQQRQFRDQGNQAAANNPIQDMIDSLQDRLDSTEDTDTAVYLQMLISQLSQLNTGTSVGDVIGNTGGTATSPYQSIPTNPQPGPTYILNNYSMAPSEEVVASFRRLEAEERARY